MSIELTQAAAERVRSMLAKRGHGLGLRLGTRKSGCSGYAYVVDYADETGSEDVVFETNGVTVVVDKTSLPQLDGLKIDYVRTNALNEGFEFNNPNVRDECGCGESFNV
jgi:iron-sulfur cluster assembly protein